MRLFSRKKSKERNKVDSPPALPELALPKNNSLPDLLEVNYGAAASQLGGDDARAAGQLGKAAQQEHQPGSHDGYAAQTAPISIPGPVITQVNGAARIDPSGGHGRVPSRIGSSPTGEHYASYGSAHAAPMSGHGESFVARPSSSPARTHADELAVRTSGLHAESGGGGRDRSASNASEARRALTQSPVRQFHRPYPLGREGSISSQAPTPTPQQQSHETSHDIKRAGSRSSVATATDLAAGPNGSLPFPNSFSSPSSLASYASPPLSNGLGGPNGNGSYFSHRGAGSITTSSSALYGTSPSPPSPTASLPQHSPVKSHASLHPHPLPSPGLHMHSFRVSPSLHTGIGVAGGVTGAAHAHILNQPMYSIAASHALGADVVASTTLSPDAARRAVDMARRKSLKKSKAPHTFNVLLIGAKGAGKTTFVRTLLDTVDLGACSLQARRGKSQHSVGAMHDDTHMDEC